MKSVSLMYVELTTNCNSRCKYCNYWLSENKDIDNKILKKIENNFNNIKIHNLILTGGEPLLHKNFTDIVKYLKKTIDPNVYTLMTNGLLLNKYQKFISKYFNRVIISIDGFDEDTYLSTRGINGFSKVLNNIRLFKEKYKNIELRVKVTVFPQYIKNIPDFIKLARQNNIDTISFNALDTINQNSFARDFTIGKKNEYDINIIDNAIKQLKETKDIQNIVYEDIDVLHQTLLKNTTINKKFPNCNAFDNTIIVHTNGDVKMCFFTEAIGNINDATLAEILQSNKAKFLKKQFMLKQLKECIDCVCPYYIKKQGDMPYRT